MFQFFRVATIFISSRRIIRFLVRSVAPERSIFIVGNTAATTKEDVNVMETSQRGGRPVLSRVLVEPASEAQSEHDVFRRRWLYLFHDLGVAQREHGHDLEGEREPELVHVDEVDVFV